MTIFGESIISWPVMNTVSEHNSERVMAKWGASKVCSILTMLLFSEVNFAEKNASET